MRRQTRSVLAVLALIATIAGVGVAPVSAHISHKSSPESYELIGDKGGSKFEGIGVDRRQQTFYVSEVTGGEIHRGNVRTGETEEWLPEGADDRFTARGITTDKRNRIYIAGGPNGLGNERPDLWVYNSDGTLLTALKVGEPGAFINDVVIGPDGAAYFTNSNAPQIFRLSEYKGEWAVTTWADANGIISQEDGFNLGGIVVSRNRKALIVAQGNVGKLWRFDLGSAAASEVEVGDADLANADGLVRRGKSLIVVRNFSRMVTTLGLNGNGDRARLINEVATDPDKVFTTAKIARGRLLLIDSHFDEQMAQPPYEVSTIPLRSILR